MSTTLTAREARVLRGARECAEQCDVTRAKRTDPTPAQVRRARKNWHGPRALDRLVQVLRWKEARR